ncbi:MAG: hypothetical protein AAB514_01710 [Patescibacteria group bacterium]
MRFKAPKNTDRFLWTNHAARKIIFYGLSEQKIKRIINHPDRTEEGVALNTIACMQIAGSKKHYQEIWTMYQKKNLKQLKIISAWRYPGKSPAKNPIPPEILAEIKGFL